MKSLRKRASVSACLAGLIMFFAAGTAQALTVDPVTGGSGFNWWFNGLGSSHIFTDDTVFDPAVAQATGDDTLDVTVAMDSLFDLGVLDCCEVGDEFALTVDGAAVAWTMSGFTGTDFAGRTGMFEASVVGLLLTTGTHTIDLVSIGVAPGFPEFGTGDWTLSKATKATAVPLPASFLLFLTGLGGFRFLAKRRQPELMPRVFRVPKGA